MQIIIIGIGHLGQSLAIRLLRNSDLDIELVFKDQKALKKFQDNFSDLRSYKYHLVSENKLLVLDDRLVILCLKLKQVDTIKKHGQAKLVMSPVVGLDFTTLARVYPAKGYVQFMPNIHALNGDSVSPCLLNKDVHARVKVDAEKVLKHFGDFIWLEDKASYDSFSAFTACTPAFLALSVEALADAAVNIGLPKKTANALLIKIFDGFTKHLKYDTASHIKESVISPAGISTAGIKALEDHKIRHGYIQSLEASLARLRQLQDDNI